MEFRDEQRRFNAFVIDEGTTPLEMEDTMKRAGINAPQRLKDKWVKRFSEKADSIVYPQTPRLVNRFAVGADPEFALTGPNGEYTHASNCGLDMLHPFGCDLSGRQGEFRAHPSRFVLEVVASLIDTMRWMQKSVNGIENYSWNSVSYLQRDGFGGHVHFGRKRPFILDEVNSLDVIYRSLSKTQVFNPATTLDREKRTKYGHFGDYRKQLHGYEYRTMPTWLSSPWAAFFTLVVSKLAVHHGELKYSSPKKYKQQILNLIAAYRRIDDDAAIAYRALQVLGYPIHDESDFKSRWGVSNIKEGRIAISHTWFPSTIPPDAFTNMELFNFLTDGTVIPQRTPLLTWPTSELKDGFSKVTIGERLPGLSDIAVGLVSKDCFVTLHGNVRDILQIVTSLPLNQERIHASFNKTLASGKIKSGMVIPFSPDVTKKYINIHIPHKIATNYVADTRLCRQIRDFLSDSSIFPICDGKDLSNVVWPDKYAVEEIPKAVKYLGKEI
jgi:hypothetical protein